LEEKAREKVTEEGSLSPFGRGSKRKGNRGRFSELNWKRKQEKR